MESGVTRAYFARHSHAPALGGRVLGRGSRRHRAQEKFQYQVRERRSYIHHGDAVSPRTYAGQPQERCGRCCRILGRSDREDPPDGPRSMIQAATLLNHDLIRDRVKCETGEPFGEAGGGKPPNIRRGDCGGAVSGHPQPASVAGREKRRRSVARSAARARCGRPCSGRW